VVPPEVLAYGRALSEALARPGMVGVYLHGSAVLGGFRPGASDVDVIAVVAVPLDDQLAVGESLAAVPGCPGTALELSVVTAATAAVPGDCPFEVHVNTGRAVAVTPGAGHPGDPDLVLHCAVCREHAVAVTGPAPREVFGPVPRERVLAALVAELEWAVERAPATYAVLNACRALRFAACGDLCSKVDGGDWYLGRQPGDRVVLAALASQRTGPPGPTPREAARFVTAVLARLR
jgi:streptomycin 3"-adenylyltransferase